MSREKVDQAKVEAAVRAQAQDGQLRCAAAFRIARNLGATPLAVGQAADAVGVKLIRCQLGLFGYGEQNKHNILEPMDSVEGVTPELARAIREGLVLDKLPCAVAWSLATRFRISKIDVANAADTLGVHIRQCQLGAF
ncbi:MAG TPA: hypothetical protein ENN19_14815 [Chloroflexi bacterium]|nr:hypothetical protein [Chloroflexota bacterium]